MDYKSLSVELVKFLDENNELIGRSIASAYFDMAEEFTNYCQNTVDEVDHFIDFPTANIPTVSEVIDAIMRVLGNAFEQKQSHITFVNCIH